MSGPPDELRLNVLAVFEDDGAPVPTLPIYAHCESPPELLPDQEPEPHDFWLRRGVTDSSGRVVLELPAHVKWTLGSSLDEDDGVEWDSGAIEPGGTSEVGVPAGVMRIRVLDAEDEVLGTQDVKLGSGPRLELRLTTLGG